MFHRWHIASPTFFPLNTFSVEEVIKDGRCFWANTSRSRQHVRLIQFGYFCLLSVSCRLGAAYIGVVVAGWFVFVCFLTIIFWRCNSLYGGLSFRRLPLIIFAEIALVSCVQAWYYFTHQSDRWHLKLLVNNIFLSEFPPLLTLKRRSARRWCLIRYTKPLS